MTQQTTLTITKGEENMPKTGALRRIFNIMKSGFGARLSDGGFLLFGSDMTFEACRDSKRKGVVLTKVDGKKYQIDLTDNGKELLATEVGQDVIESTSPIMTWSWKVVSEENTATEGPNTFEAVQKRFPLPLLDRPFERPDESLVFDWVGRGGFSATLVFKSQRDVEFLNHTPSPLSGFGRNYNGDEIILCIVKSMVDRGILHAEFRVVLTMHDTFAISTATTRTYRLDVDHGDMIETSPLPVAGSRHGIDIKIYDADRKPSREERQRAFGRGHEIPTKPTQQEEAQIPTRTWIPQLNQYVRVEGDNDLYVIMDFDQYENKFLVTRADSCRRERASRLGRERDEGRMIAIEPGRLRPYVLFY